MLQPSCYKVRTSQPLYSNDPLKGFIASWRHVWGIPLLSLITNAPPVCQSCKEYFRLHGQLDRWGVGG